ncbi:MAG: NADH-quinone oxidoreductase subunit C [Eubacteriales bacterium]|nr:NADH-quinone oxidoreductase subunit C [Eubacteriales bacterium]
MSEVICPDNELIEITPENLLNKVMEMKRQGLRLSQACAAVVNEKYELSYSFAQEGTYRYITLRLVIDTSVEIPSITEFYPYAFLYENEMKELFGVKIKLINLDYNDKLYRIKEETPFLKKKEEQ